MACLAGIGGRVSGIVTSAQAADKLLVIDGCAQACGKRCLEAAGFSGFRHLCRREGTWIHYSLKEAATPLARQLHTYLSEGRCGPVQADRHRLQELARTGQLCGPHAAVTRCC
jgi:hypothetical protein